MTVEQQFRRALIALPVFIVPLPLFLAFTYFFLFAPLDVDIEWTYTVMHLFQWFKPLGLSPILRVIGLGASFWAAAQCVRVLLYFTLRKTRWASAA